MRHALLLLLLAAFGAAATGVSGKWTGTGEARLPDGSPISGTLFLALEQQQDGRLSGSAGCDEASAQPIRNGKTDGVKVRFEITNPRNGVVSKFDLSLAGEDQLEGSVSAEAAGVRRTMTLKLARVKPAQ